MTSKLTTIALMITDRCNHNCYHCFRKSKSESVNFDISLINQLINRLDNRKVESVRLTGGEPFIIKDLHHIIEKLSNKDIDSSIITNGTLLSQEQIIKMANAGLNYIGFTIHSLKNENHDKLTSNKGSLKRLLKAIYLAAEIGLPIALYLPVSIYNCFEIYNLIEFAFNLPIIKLRILSLSPFGNARYLATLPDTKWFDIVNKIKRLKLDPTIPLYIQNIVQNNPNGDGCTIEPLKFINCDVNGYLYSCCILCSHSKFSIGNISELISEDWNYALNNIARRNQFLYDNKRYGELPCTEIGNFNKRRIYCPLQSERL
ncbi:MAG: radical SAM protein [candidate division Zixibacteria bacterium]|nr:radical SAM protein [candidate division Zixibacteria bacterium]